MISPKSFGSKSRMELCTQQTISLVDGFYILVIIFQKKSQKNYSLLEPKSNWDKESVGKMIDNTSSVAPDGVRI
jgi:hypothetical protein